MIPVNIVTGFLGSGKTTLLRDVLQHPDLADSAVIVNEFGEIGLDHLLLEEVEEGVLLLASGCVCCSIRSDLRDAIRGLQDRAAAGAIPRFRRIVVETTGLADPAPILSTLLAEPVLRHHFRIGNILCTVDAVNGLGQLDRQPESRKQALAADRLLITKCDLAAEAALAALEAKLALLNPAARRMHGTGSGFDALALFTEDVGAEEHRLAEVRGWLAGVDSSPAAGHRSEGSGIHSFCLTWQDPMDWTLFGIWLTALLHRHGEQVLRVKGILNARGSATPVVIHGVQHVVHPPLHLAGWPGPERTSRILFITQGLSEARLRKSLAGFLALGGIPADS